jgi:hypothetical protein
MQTPVTPSVDIGGLNTINRDNNDDDDEQNFYSAPPSRMFTKKKQIIKLIKERIFSY